MFNVDFPQDTDSVKFRAVQWICTEVLLALAALLNFLPRMLRASPPSSFPVLTIHHSPLLQVCFLGLRRIRHA